VPSYVDDTRELRVIAPLLFVIVKLPDKDENLEAVTVPLLV
jgi:hypothetical protein